MPLEGFGQKIVVKANVVFDVQLCSQVRRCDSRDVARRFGKRPNEPYAAQKRGIPQLVSWPTETEDRTQVILIQGEVFGQVFLRERTIEAAKAFALVCRALRPEYEIGYVHTR